MTAPPPFAARALDNRNPGEVEAARALAARKAAHGIYVGNHLSGHGIAGEGGEVLAFWGAEELLGVGFFGLRGNLILVGAEDLDGDAVASAVHAAGWGWRIVLGPRSAVQALARAESSPPLVHRRQVYCGMRPADVPPSLVRSDVRLAERRDQARLLAAALDLNEADLGVDPQRVHKPWLKDSIRRRVKAGQTWVLGPPPQVTCKLDVGSDGPCGMMVEGVYTFPERRAEGLAAGLVATVASRCGAPWVCLHVAEDNEPARRAYERAGMTPMGDCELMLRSA